MSLVPALKTGSAAFKVGKRAFELGTAAKTYMSKRFKSSSAIYGATYTARRAYKRHPAPRRVKRRSRGKFRSHVSQALKLQRPQFFLLHNRLVTTSNALNNQTWTSVDILNGGTMRQMVEGQVPAGSGPTLLRDITLFLKSFRLRIYMTNPTSNPCIVDMYLVQPRRSITALEMDVVTVPSNGYVLSNWFTNHFTGVLQPSGADLLPDTHNDPIPDWASLGASPFQYESFCRMFKILSVDTALINPGAIYEKSFSVKGKPINLARLGQIGPNAIGGGGSNANTNVWYMPGYSQALLMRIRGIPSDTAESVVSGVTVGWEETATSKVVQTRSSSNALLPSGS